MHDNAKPLLVVSDALPLVAEFFWLNSVLEVWNSHFLRYLFFSISDVENHGVKNQVDVLQILCLLWYALHDDNFCDLLTTNKLEIMYFGLVS